MTQLCLKIAIFKCLFGQGDILGSFNPFGRSPDRAGQANIGQREESGVVCAMSTRSSREQSVRYCLTDEGRPLGIGLQERIPNHLRRLWSKAMVVSAEGKGPA
jgi:hypothetical protein